MQIVTVRASSWPDLFDCAARWKAKNLDGIRMPSGAKAHLGTSIHAGTAAFDQAVLDRNPITPDEAAGAFIDTLYHPKEEVDWASEDSLTIRDAERIGLQLHTRYCTVIAPEREYAGVEIQCNNLEVQVTDDVIINLTGTTDRVRIRDGELAISDLKSGTRRVSAKGEVDAKADGAQLAVYELLAEHALGQPITGTAEIIGLQTSGAGHVAAADVHNTRVALIGTEDEPGLIQMAAMFFQSGMFPPNPKSALCSKKFCPVFSSCKYHN